MLETPVLFIIFNRPETTAKVFESIRQAKPKQLFVAADGPRAGKEGEKQRCEKTRKIATAVNWECELHTLFRDDNIGCGRGPAEAITWFFEHVEQGIILEDDCLPSHSFFPFCEELLNKYRHDQRIMEVSGLNLLSSFSSSFSYLYSQIATGTWGWATWRRAWNLYDYDLKLWQAKESIEKVESLFRYKPQRDQFVAIFEQTFKKENISWWDYQWFFSRILNNGLSIVPKKNLIKNIGFGPNATHTFDEKAKEAKLKFFALQFPLKHPEEVSICESFEIRLFRKEWMRKPNLWIRLKNKANNLLKSNLDGM